MHLLGNAASPLVWGSPRTPPHPGLAHDSLKTSRATLALNCAADVCIPSAEAQYHAGATVKGTHHFRMVAGQLHIRAAQVGAPQVDAEKLAVLVPVGQNVHQRGDHGQRAAAILSQTRPHLHGVLPASQKRHPMIEHADAL